MIQVVVYLEALRHALGGDEPWFLVELKIVSG